MNLRTRFAALACAASLGLTGLSLAPIAQATIRPAISVAAIEGYCPADVEVAAVEWVASLWETKKDAFTAGFTAESVFALAAVGADEGLIDELLAHLKTLAPKYTENPGGAAKLAIALQAMGEDPTNFAGLDLVKIMQDALAKDPTAEGIYNLPYVVIALVREGVEVPDSAVKALLESQDASGAWGFQDWQDKTKFVADADTTAAVLMALAGLEEVAKEAKAADDLAAAKAAADKAIAWLSSTRNAKGYWDGYSPVNTTAMVLMGLRAWDQDEAETKAFDYLLKAQEQAGGKGFPNSPTGTEPELYATVQAIQGLSDMTLLNLEWAMAECPDVETSVTTTPTASATTTPTAGTGASTSTGTSTKPTPGKMPKTGN